MDNKDILTMNTKEAIEWLKDAEKAAELNEWRIDSIISLLNQGEKYRQIVEELNRNWGKYNMIERRERRNVGYDVRNIIKDLEQKYIKETK